MKQTIVVQALAAQQQFGGIYFMEPETLSGEELYDRFQKGDVSAFEELVEMYKDPLFSFIKGIVPDWHDAEELLIDTFAQLALSASRFEGRASLKTYIFTIGRNLAVKHLKTRRHDELVSYDDALSALVDDEGTPERSFELEEDKRVLHEALKTLKEQYRVVLELLYFEDMSYTEAAAAMNKSVDQVNNLAYRAKAALRKKLAQKKFSGF